MLYHHPPRAARHTPPRFAVPEILLVTAIVLLVLAGLLVGAAAFGGG